MTAPPYLVELILLRGAPPCPEHVVDLASHPEALVFNADGSVSWWLYEGDPEG